MLSHFRCGRWKNGSRSLPQAQTYTTGHTPTREEDAFLPPQINTSRFVAWRGAFAPSPWIQTVLPSHQSVGRETRNRELQEIPLRWAFCQSFNAVFKRAVVSNPRSSYREDGIRCSKICPFPHTPVRPSALEQLHDKKFLLVCLNKFRNCTCEVSIDRCPVFVWMCCFVWIMRVSNPESPSGFRYSVSARVCLCFLAVILHFVVIAARNAFQRSQGRGRQRQRTQQQQ